jgi:hypothetical protein
LTDHHLINKKPVGIADKPTLAHPWLGNATTTTCEYEMRDSMKISNCTKVTEKDL